MWPISRWKMVGEMCVGCDFDESRRATCEGTEAS